jgi:hypothetical protein
MQCERQSKAEIRDVVPGLWIWRVSHAMWRPNQGWDPIVASTVVESQGETLVFDPLAPPESEAEVWNRLDTHKPMMVVVLKPDHVRDVDLIVERYGCRAFGPDRFERHNVPKTELEPVFPGTQLPRGIVALYDGRGRNETPLWLPVQRALVFANALTAPCGELLIWSTPWHQKRVLPALRELLELPFEHVIVSHGEPAHKRAAIERALQLPPWTGS